MWVHARKSRVTEMRKNRSLVGGFVVISVGGSELLPMHAPAVVETAFVLMRHSKSLALSATYRI